MKKEFKFEAILSTTEFDRSVEQMVKKMKDVQQPITAMQQNTQARVQQNGLGGGMSGPSMEAFQKATQGARRELDSMISAEAKSQQSLGKFIAQRTEAIKQMVAEQKKLIQGSEEEFKIREKIARAEANQQQLKDQYRQKDANLNQMLDTKEQMAANQAQAIKDRNPEGWGRAKRYADQGMYGSAGREAYGAVGGLAGIGGALGTVAGTIGSIGLAGERVTGYGQRLQAAQGSAIENSAGQNLRDVYSGRSPFENQFQGERAAAAGLAAQKEGRNRWTDRMKGIGSIGALGLGAAGMVGGGILALGGTIASPFTGGTSLAGTALGVQMMAGGAASIGVGVNGLSNDRTRQSINPFGQSEYDRLLKADQAKDFRASYEDLKNQDPGKKLTMEQFEAERQRNVSIQRTLGLSNNQFYKGGGFLAGIQQGGYMGEQGINMANSIVGAGGSSRMGTQARFGLDMERSGLTNASSILGTMSGSIQNPEANKRATISIMSEAFKIGLDNTTFAEENRRFAQAAANVIGRTGATSESDQEKLTATLAQFMGQKTNAGVQEAQGAYEKYQERGSQTTGRRGALRFQAALKDQNLSKMSTSDLTELLSMRPEEMNASNPAMAAFAKSAGISVDKLVEKMTGKGGVNEAGRHLFPGQKDKIRDMAKIVGDYAKQNGMSYDDIGDASRQGKLPKNIQEAFGQGIIETNKSESGGITSGGGIAAFGEFVKGVDRAGGGKAKAQSDLENGPGRLEDAFTKKAAEGADEARKNFNQLTESLWKVVGGTNALVQSMNGVPQALGNAAAANRAGLPQGNAFNTDISATASGAKIQPSPSKPKGGQ